MTRTPQGSWKKCLAAAASRVADSQKSMVAAEILQFTLLHLHPPVVKYRHLFHWEVWMLTRRILVLIAFSSAMLDAQNITGSIVGQVTDASGSAVPAAAITVKNMDTGLTAQTITDTSGSYSLPNLLAGTYEITVRKTGFQTTSVSRLALLSTQTLRQDVSLQLGT